MTVADNTSRNQYSATSGQTVFAYTFEIVDKDDIVVLKNGTTLSEGTDYAVSNVGNDGGGNVTLTVGATTGDVLTLYRDMPYSRTQNYTNSGDFLASEVNSDFDNLWLAGEQTNRAFSQSIRKPITDSDSISMELPEAADRTDSFLTFDSTGAVSTSPLSSALSPSIIARQQFTGDGATTVFTLAADPGSPAGVVIYIDGVYQEEVTYSVSGSTVTFTEAPPTNASIEVVSYKTTAVGTTDANSVTYLPAGTGAVQTTVQTKLRESVSVKDFGAVGDGVTDDTAAIQAAIDYGSVVYFPAGNYLMSNASTLLYRGSTSVNVGISVPSNRTLKFDGINTKFTVKDSTRAVVFASSGSENISFKGSFTIEGNASNQTDANLVGFGIYLLNCTNIEIDTIFVNETKSNTIQVMGCSDVSVRHIHSTTTSAGGSGGGGPQFEDCTNITASTFSGYTYDDLVSVIAHSSTVTDVSLGEINGGSENARALFIGQSSSASAQRSILDVTANVNSYDSGIGGSTAAFVINNGAVYRNINVSVFDRSSYAAVRITPYDATYNGTLESCSFTVISHNSDTHAIDVQHNDNASTSIKNNKINAIIVNPNYADSAAYSGIRIQGGDAWDIQANVDYPSGKTNATHAIQLGGSGTNRKVTNSILAGVVNGGKPNVTLTLTDNINLDSLICINTEEPNDISIDVTSSAANTKVSSLSRDGEVNDAGTGTQRSMSKLFASTTEVATSSTSETDLITYTLPADWMGKTGVIHLRAMGEITGANGTKTITFYFGTQSRQIYSANVTGDWVADIWVWQDGTRSSQKILIDAGQGGSTVTTNSTTGSASTTGAVVIKITGQCNNASDSVTQEAVFIEGA